MANNYKSPVQVEPAANTYTTLYTVPAATQAIFSAINICNTTTFLYISSLLLIFVIIQVNMFVDVWQDRGSAVAIFYCHCNPVGLLLGRSRGMC